MTTSVDRILEVASATQPVNCDNLAANAAPCDRETPRILAELVIEEVSIDGMCGVY